MSAFCGRFSAFKVSSQGTRLVDLPCRCWSCTDCQRLLRALIRKRIMSGQPNTFLTLTVNPKLHSSREEREDVMKRGLNKLAQRARIEWPKVRFEYFAVVELTKRGEVHFHVMCQAPFIPKQWLVTQWEKLTGAIIVDVKRISSKAGATRYVTKYTSKNPERLANHRRFVVSQGYERDVKRARNRIDLFESPWHFVKCRGFLFVEDMLVRGIKFIETGDGQWFCPINIGGARAGPS